MLGILALALPALRGDRTPTLAASPVDSGQLYACLTDPSADQPGDQPCQRIVADYRQRRPLSTTEQDAAQPGLESVRSALVRHTHSDCLAPPAPCAERILPADPTEVRRQLADAGYADAVVRAYRDGDPAPAGSLVYAVRAGTACLLGYLPRDTAGQVRAVGPLPDGSCLPA